KIKKKRCTSDLLENIAKETFSRKLALTLSKTGTIDYGNEEIEQQILAFLNSIKEEGQKSIEEAERNTIKQEPELKRKKVIKEEEKEKQHTINEILKEAQEVEGMKNKDIKEVRQEDSLELENEKVYFIIWDLPNRIFKKQVTEMIKKFGQPREIRILHSMNNKMRPKVEWSSIKEDIKRKLEANWVLLLRNGQLARITAGRSERIKLEKRQRKLKYFNYAIEWEYTMPYRKGSESPNERVNNKEEINQERHRLEELAQRLVEKIKEKLIWELSNSTKIGAGLSQRS
ncbi:36061_t:CDS:2, partial [Gigaspora margarita]